MPSEPELLRWRDIDWDRSVISVRSPKTEHHEGHDKREIPIFPEIMPFLQQVRQSADEGENLVLPFMQGKSGTAIRKPLIRAIESLGKSPWGSLFNALRATRDTELRESFPSHVVDYWIGHDEAVAKKHYVQVTNEHFEKGAHFTAAASRPIRRHQPANKNGNARISPSPAAGFCPVRSLARVFSGR